MKTQTHPTTLRRLTKTEIDDRIDTLVQELATAPRDEDLDPVRPRWISAADLVRRMRPFIVLN